MTAAAIAKQERIAGKLRSDLRSLAPPAVDALVHAGVLVELGNWYRVQCPDDLPTRLCVGARIIRLHGLMLIKFDVAAEDYPT